MFIPKTVWLSRFVVLIIVLIGFVASLVAQSNTEIVPTPQTSFNAETDPRFLDVVGEIDKSSPKYEKILLTTAHLQADLDRIIDAETFDDIDIANCFQHRDQQPINNQIELGLDAQPYQE